MTPEVIAAGSCRFHPAASSTHKAIRMTRQIDKARRFHSLHLDGPLVLFNIWDPGSAKAVAEAGAQAIATGSWSVAAANGYPDGEAMPLALALDNIARIAAACDLPLTVDLERGYDDVGATVRGAIAAGAVGCNLEDGLADGMRAIEDQAARIAAARAAADAAGVPMFINARTDLFLQAAPDTHDAALVDQALQRAQAYAAAGADGVFVPGLVDASLIASLVDASPLPVNIMVLPAAPPLARLAELGVARVSHGPGPYLVAMQGLAAAAAEAGRR
jgi:2-methylisocitrate lyase-like PEP mutase family enzyme